jgi:hypothetical protein
VAKFRWPWSKVGDNGYFSANGTGAATDPYLIDIVRKDSKGVEVVQLNSAFGEQAVVEYSPQWQQSFEYTVDNTDLNTNILVAGGTITQATAMAVIASSTTSASQATLKSTHHARYKAGFGGMARFSAVFSTPVATAHMYAGLADEVGTTAEFINGLMIGYNGTNWAVARYQNDVAFEIAQSSWDDPLDGTGKSGVTIDFTKLNIFYIQFQYLGAGAIYFWTEHPETGVPFRFHTIPYANLYTTPSTYNPNYHMTFHADNKATTSNVSVSTASYGYFIEGKTELVEFHQPQNTTGTVVATGVTLEVALFTIRNKATYAGKVNYIDILLERYSASIEAGAANNLGTVRIVKNATLGGTPEWNDINTTNSVVEIDVLATTVAGGKELLSIDLAGKNDSDKENLIPYKIVIHPLETVTFTGSSAAVAEMRDSLLWKELF